MDTEANVITAMTYPCDYRRRSMRGQLRRVCPGMEQEDGLNEAFKLPPPDYDAIPCALPLHVQDHHVPQQEAHRLRVHVLGLYTQDNLQMKARGSTRSTQNT
jgi:hypothetical protein